MTGVQTCALPICFPVTIPPVMDSWTEEDVKRLVMEYVTRKPTIIERVVPDRLLSKQRRKYIQDELNRLTAELDK